MKIKKYLSIILFLFISNLVYSNPVDSTLAKEIAINYFLFLNPSRAELEIKNTIVKYYNGYPSYYIINFKESGYIAVSANDATVPILMYSYDGEYKENDFHNPAYLDWMENYSKEIDSVRIYNIPNDSTIQEWNNILNKNFNKYKSNKSVSPLIKTCWGQSHTNDGYCPGYNSLCPSDNDCDCDHCSAGCVAIAMAQIMKYWMHPVYSTYSPYDWCNMPNLLCMFENCDIITKNPNPSFEIQQIAIATLVHDCGTSANMNYCFSYCSSGTYIDDARNAFVNNFEYNSDAIVKERSNHPFNWKNLLKNDLDSGRPIFYSGSSSYGGHAFVCDGYNSDNKFHFNWGWRCKDDGYFELSKLNPDIYNFTQNQRAIFNLHPAWYIDCNSVLQVLQIYESFPLIQLSYYNPVAGTIIAGGSVAPLTIQSDQTVHYNAYRQIDLLDGFTAENGSNFTAEIIPCPSECPDNSKSKIISSDNYNEEIDFDTLYGRDTSITKKEIVELKFQIYPNPNNGIFNIVVETTNKTDLIIELMNIQGQIIYRNNVKGVFIYKDQVNVSDFAKGIYFLRINTVDKVEIRKIVIQ
jgi:hypothetical protein